MKTRKFILEGKHLNDFPRILGQGLSHDYQHHSKAKDTWILLKNKYTGLNEAHTLVFIIEFLNDKQCQLEILAMEDYHFAKIITWIEEACRLNQWYLQEIS